MNKSSSKKVDSSNNSQRNDNIKKVKNKIRYNSIIDSKDIKQNINNGINSNNHNYKNLGESILPSEYIVIPTPS